MLIGWRSLDSLHSLEMTGEGKEAARDDGGWLGLCFVGSLDSLHSLEMTVRELEMTGEGKEAARDDRERKPLEMTEGY